jgi:hypothetical protein
MKAHRHPGVRELHSLIAHGQYAVDVGTVADAIIGRVSGLDLARDYPGLYAEPDRHPAGRLTGEGRGGRRAMGEGRRGQQLRPPQPLLT